MVALQLDRSLEQVVGIVGVLRSGGAYLPLDPVWPLARRRFMVEDASCSHLVAQHVHVLSSTVWFVVRCWSWTMLWRVSSTGSASACRLAATDAQHLAYVMFTSGLTGKPKGVMVPHAGLVNLHASLSFAQCLHGDVRCGLSANYVLTSSRGSYVTADELLVGLRSHCSSLRLARLRAREDLTVLVTFHRSSALHDTHAVWGVMVAGGALAQR